MDVDRRFPVRRNRRSSAPGAARREPQTMERAFQVALPAGSPAAGRGLLPYPARDPRPVPAGRDQGDEEVFRCR